MCSKYEEKKVGVAGLKPTRSDNSKGTLIGPSLFYTSKLYYKYIKSIHNNCLRFYKVYLS